MNYKVNFSLLGKESWRLLWVILGFIGNRAQWIRPNRCHGSQAKLVYALCIRIIILNDIFSLLTWAVSKQRDAWRWLDCFSFHGLLFLMVINGLALVVTYCIHTLCPYATICSAYILIERLFKLAAEITQHITYTDNLYTSLRHL